MQYRLLILAASIGLTGFASARPHATAPVQPQPQPAIVATPQPAAAAPKADARAAAVDNALEALSSQVTRLSNDDALRTAFKAYYSFKAAHPERVQNPYFYFVDYGLNNRTPRGYVFDMSRSQLDEKCRRHCHSNKKFRCID